MIKGCQKRAVFVKNTGSSIFEGAYFILKDKYSEEALSDMNIVSEANRIIEENSDFLPQRKRGPKALLKGFISGIRKRVPVFLVGVIFGIVLGLFLSKMLL